MLKLIALLLATLVAATGASGQSPFTGVTEAIAALAKSPNESKWAAVTYLANHPEESLPQLFRLMENQEDGWIYASAALVRSKDARVLPFLLELLRNNFFLKEADGSRKQFGLGTKNGCTAIPNMLGSVVAQRLGELGDKRATDTLWDAASQGDPAVRDSAYAALYALGGLSLDELFDMAKEGSDGTAEIIEEIGWQTIQSDTNFAIRLFDRIIAEIPGDEYRVASAHFWKVQCFELLKDYDNALRECQEVMKFTKYDNLVSQAKEKWLRLQTKRSTTITADTNNPQEDP